MATVYEKLGSRVLPREFKGIGLENTPQYDPYENEIQNDQTFPQLAEELELMPEVGNHYIGAKMLLPRGEVIAWDHIVASSCNASGNLMDRAHTNPILDTRMYQVEFVGGKVTELTTNIIAESIYAQCDGDRKEYLLHVLVDYHKYNKVISLPEQGQTSNWYDHCMLANFLLVKGWFYLMEEVVQVKGTKC